MGRERQQENSFLWVCNFKSKSLFWQLGPDYYLSINVCPQTNKLNGCSLLRCRTWRGKNLPFFSPPLPPPPPHWWQLASGNPFFEIPFAGLARQLLRRISTMANFGFLLRWQDFRFLRWQPDNYQSFPSSLRNEKQAWPHVGGWSAEN